MATLSSKIEFVYFDLGKVILDFSHERQCQQMAAVAGVSVDLVREVVFDNDLETRYETGLISTAQFHAEFCEATKSQPAEQALLLAACDIFSLNQRIVPVITGLAARGIRLGVLSNTCDVHWRYVFQRYKVLADFFRWHVLSYEVKSMKPERAIYDYAIQQAGVPAQNIFFMDDKPENAAGAVKAGMDAVLFESEIGLVKDLAKRGILL